MQNPYRVQVLSFESSPIFLERGFLKCVVEQLNPPFASREFAYCLHCKLLRSVPRFYTHDRMISFRPSSYMCRFFLEKFGSYVDDILTEVDMLNDRGKLFPLPRERIPPPLVPSEQCHRLPSFQDSQQGPLFVQDFSGFFQDESDGIDQDNIEDESSISIEQLARCIATVLKSFVSKTKRLTSNGLLL